MKHAKYTFLLFLFFAISNVVFAANDTTKAKTHLDFGADLYSRYIWRGTRYGGDSPNIQPGISFSYKNFETGAWGAYSLGGVNPYQEMDLYIKYNFIHDMFSAIITDYYFPDENGTYHYFDYSKNSTGHVFEGGVSYNGINKVPLTFSAFVNFYGADAAKLGTNPSDTTIFNKKTGIQYSNYFELGYSLSAKIVDLNFFVGFTLNNPKKANNSTGFIGETGYYGDKPGVVNLGLSVSKTIKITKSYSIDLVSSLITNPETQRVFLIFGISL